MFWEYFFIAKLIPVHNLNGISLTMYDYGMRNDTFLSKFLNKFFFSEVLKTRFHVIFFAKVCC